MNANKNTPARRAIAAIVLVAALALDARTISTALHVDSVNQLPAVTMLTGAELRAHQPEVVGTFATGDERGDRILEVTADGHIGFSQIGTDSNDRETSDTYRLGRHDKKLCLVTGAGDLIDVENIDALVYFRDTYRRK